MLIRPVRPADDGLLADGFARLSDRSRRMRFLGPKEGTELLARLSERGRQEGIDHFSAAVSADNAPMAGLLPNFGGDLMRRDVGTLEYEVELGHAWHLLRIR